ncbi:hypothetical protein KSP39_PZI004698 [Platanthera zijinensis]|uniref:Uncharacterized protein n=1 Tax=Platanthera zijinensis TaxID=2320716 RepID=A0AAP0GCU3_9ASPA
MPCGGEELEGLARSCGGRKGNESWYSAVGGGELGRQFAMGQDGEMLVCDGAELGEELFKDDISWIYLFPPPRNELLVFTGLSAKFHYQMNLKMGFRFFHPQVLGGSLQGSGPHGRHVNCATSRGNHCQWFSPEDEFDQKPFWMTIVDDITRTLRSLALFLVEQPSQLKYIEWPSIENTVKRLTIPLCIMSFLIVFLYSIPLTLWFLSTVGRKDAA